MYKIKEKNIFIACFVFKIDIHVKKLEKITFLLH